MNWQKPIRTVRSKRPLFVVGCSQKVFAVALRRDDVAVAYYHSDGRPTEDGPLGEVENYDPAAEVFLAQETVQTPRQRRAMAELEANPLFGVF